MSKEVFNKLKQLIEDAGYEAISYSGRGMFGNKCIGFECPDVITGTAALFDACMDQNLSSGDLKGDYYLLSENFKQSKTDNMGLGYIIYFPNIEWSE